MAQDRQCAEASTRAEEAWTLREAHEGATLDLGSVGARIAMSDLYAGG